VGNINIIGMIGGIGDMGAENLALPVHSSFFGAGFTLDNQTHGPGPQDGAVPVLIKGFGRFRHPLFNGGGPQGQES